MKVVKVLITVALVSPSALMKTSVVALRSSYSNLSVVTISINRDACRRTILEGVRRKAYLENQTLRNPRR